MTRVNAGRITDVSVGRGATVATARRPSNIKVSNDGLFKGAQPEINFIGLNVENDPSNNRVNISAEEINQETQSLQDQITNLVVGSGVEVFVDAYGAVGDGVTDDIEAIRNAIASVNTGYAIIRFSPNKTYLITNSIPMYSGHVYVGYGSEIKRGNEELTTLAGTASISASSQTITVVDGSIFEVDDTLVLLDVDSSGGGAKNRECSNEVAVTVVNGNQITISGVLGVPENGVVTTIWPIGTKVLKTYAMFAPTGFDPTIKANGFYGLEIDGNRDNNTATHDWRNGDTVRGPSYNTVFRDCIFHDIPRETIVASSGQLVDSCLFYNTNGSCVHIGNGSYNTDPDKGNVRVVNNIMRDVCFYGTEVDNHAEGAITVSTGVDKTYIVNNLLQVCGSALYARTSAWEGNLEAETFIYNNRCYDTNGIFEALSTEQVNKNIFIENNHFDTCKSLWFSEASGNDSRISIGAGYDNILIKGNSFINTRFFGRYCSNLTIEGNNFITDANYVYTDAFTTGVATNIRGTITLANSSFIRITGNTLDNRNITSIDEWNTWGIVLDHGDVENVGALPNKLTLIKTDASTETEYAYANRNVTVSDNHIINYKWGISDWLISPNFGGRVYYDQIRRFKWMNIKIHDNHIQMSKDSTSAYGIVCGPGCEVIHNTVIGDSNTDAGIFVLGVNDGAGSAYSGTARNTLNGPLVKNNRVIGIDVSVIVGNTGSGTVGHNIYNARVIDNEVDGTVTDNTSGNSTVSGTITLINETIPLYQLRQNPEFY